MNPKNLRSIGLVFALGLVVPAIQGCCCLGGSGGGSGSTGTCYPTGSTCIDFDGLTVGTQYENGDSFTEDGTLVRFGPFQWSNGTWTLGNTAEVDPGAQAGGSGNSMQLNNVNADFGVGCATRVSLHYGEYGGNVNLRINGELRNTGNFSTLNGATIGGATIAITLISAPGAHNEFATLEATGTITDFAIGGQELWIDDVCIER